MIPLVPAIIFGLSKILRDTASEKATSSCLLRVFNASECVRRSVAGCGAKSPRNFLNVLAKCSNPRYIYPATLRTRVCASVRGCVWIFPLRTLLCDRERYDSQKWVKRAPIKMSIANETRGVTIIDQIQSILGRSTYDKTWRKTRAITHLFGPFKRVSLFFFLLTNKTYLTWEACIIFTLYLHKITEQNFRRALINLFKIFKMYLNNNSDI